MHWECHRMRFFDGYFDFGLMQEWVRNFSITQWGGLSGTQITDDLTMSVVVTE